MNHESQLKMLLNYSNKSAYFLFLLLIIEIKVGSTTYTREQKLVLYEDCTIFNNSAIYAGEVCGTDGKTYANSFFLDCINHSEGKDIAIAHHGSCLPGHHYCDVNPIYSPVCGSDNKTWPNVQLLMCHNHKMRENVTIKAHSECEEIDYCYRDGIDTFGLNPVCASNGYTYQNVAQVKCLQKYNSTDLRILHDGGCLVSEVYKIYGNGRITCHIAKERYEWNPLCAEDGKTYPNPFIFLCNKPHLKVHSNGECNTVSHDSCIKAHKNSTLVNGTLVNEDFDLNDEVCGNDGRTYKSRHHLQCQTFHNKYLAFKHTGPCVGPDDNPCGAVSDEISWFPICGTDRITYVSPEALYCVKRRTPERKVSYLYDGIC